ncbi:hypothetical protein ACFL96_16785, partial [Thermoproteota archaeon]
LIKLVVESGTTPANVLAFTIEYSNKSLSFPLTKKRIFVTFSNAGLLAPPTAGSTRWIHF